jgi:Tfp pilus assembly protein PilN
MTNGERTRLDLASRPLRNTRFYRAVFAALTILLVVLSILAGFIFFKYGRMSRTSAAAVRGIESQIAVARDEEAKSKASAGAAAKAGRSRVDLVNSIIIRKSFAWTGLLSELEETLPDSSYITFLAPGFVTETTLGLRIKVVSRSLDDLLALVTNLNARKFKRIRVRSETADERGEIIAEIEFDYERAI